MRAFWLGYAGGAIALAEVLLAWRSYQRMRRILVVRRRILLEVNRTLAGIRTLASIR